jgi:hypothetical protein
MLQANQLVRLREAYPGRTTRQLQERVYAMFAVDGLAGDPAYAWLLEPAPRVGLLAELGRFEDAAVARSAALVLCQDRPSVKAGAASRRRRDRDRGRVGHGHGRCCRPLHRPARAAAVRRRTAGH